jgi:hypothetical protein
MWLPDKFYELLPYLRGQRVILIEGGLFIRTSSDGSPRLHHDGRPDGLCLNFP